MKLPSLLPCLLLASFCFGQTQLNFNNASFEGNGGMTLIPPGWTGCQGNNLPGADTHPIPSNPWGITHAANDGNTYVGMLGYDPNGVFANVPEGVSQQITPCLTAGITYTFDIAVRISLDKWDCETGYLHVYGGNSDCDQQELLWKSPPVTDTANWTNYSVTFTPTSNWCFISFTPDTFFTDCGIGGAGYMLLDLGDVTGSLTVSKTSVSCNDTCNGVAIASVSGGAAPIDYYWSNADTTDTITGLCPGTYKVTAVDANSQFWEDSVIIESPSPLTLSNFNDQSICLGDSVYLNPGVADGTPTYTFNWSTGESSDSILVKPNDTTTYTVTITDSKGCSVTDSVTVFIVPGITASISPDQTICLGESVTLSASGGSTYQWNTGDNTANITVSPTTNTTYSVIVSSGSCGQDTAYVNITVDEITALASGNVTICNGDSVTLTASGGSNYSWIPTDSVDQPNNAVTTVYPANTTTYSVIVTDGNCQPDTAQVTVTVVPDITANISPDLEICEGESVDLSASGGTNYSWSPNNTLNAAVGSSVTATPNVTTTYTVTVTSGTCAPASDSVTITVNPRPIADAGTNQTVQSGESINLSGSGGDNYLWLPDTSVIDPFSQEITVSPTSTTTFTLIVTNTSGCVDTAYVTITVEDECAGGAEDLLFIPSAFSPNGDGKNDVFEIRYRSSCVEIIKFIVFDRWGEKVHEVNNDKGWDGTYRNTLLNSAVFDYYLEGVLYDGKTIIRSGNVTLMR